MAPGRKAVANNSPTLLPHNIISPLSCWVISSAVICCFRCQTKKPQPTTQITAQHPNLKSWREHAGITSMLLRHVWRSDIVIREAKKYDHNTCLLRCISRPLRPFWRTLELPGLSLKLYTKACNIGLAYDISQWRPWFTRGEVQGARCWRCGQGWQQSGVFGCRRNWWKWVKLYIFYSQRRANCQQKRTMELLSCV